MASYAERWQELKGQFMNWMAEGAKDAHNMIVPAFPDSYRGVDQPGTPLSMNSEAENSQGVLFDPVRKPSFEQTMASQAPPSPGQDKAADKGMEL